MNRLKPILALALAALLALAAAWAEAALPRRTGDHGDDVLRVKQRLLCRLESGGTLELGIE